MMKMLWLISTEDISLLQGWVINAVSEANRGLEDSLFPPHYRYRIAGILPFTHDLRPHSISSLVTVRFNQYMQNQRRELGGDLSVFLVSETTSYMGFAYFLFGTFVREDRASVILNTGFAAHH